MIAKQACIKYYENFYLQNATLLNECIQHNCCDKLAKIHSRIADLNIWQNTLSGKKEATVLSYAFREYEFSILCLVQGFYRQAFASLRLFMELTLAATQLSTNEIDLRLWLAGKKDTNWSQITDQDNGIFSKVFLECFCPELTDEANHVKSIALKVYRECSEYVHGNHATYVGLPETVCFSEESFSLWAEKAKSVFLVITYILTARYIKEVNKEDLIKIEPILCDELGHTKGISLLLGKES